MEFPDVTEAMILAWHGITPSNDAAKRFAVDLASSIRAFEKVRGQMRFEDEPATFEQALHETRE
jgi:hypothetical protein